MIEEDIKMLKIDTREIHRQMQTLENKLDLLIKHLIPEKTDVSKESKKIDKELKKGAEPRKHTHSVRRLESKDSNYKKGRKVGFKAKMF